MAGEGPRALPSVALTDADLLPALLEDWHRQHPDGVVARLRGRRSVDRASFLDEVADVLAFPAWFGRNWDALSDSLADLSWLPAPSYLLVIDEADLLLRDAPDELPLLLDLLRVAATHWATPPAGSGREPVPFATVLVTPG